tara:strand:- start:2787 stop:3143 length:357 start_codon:yes stop_codon:yes gene_type:complete
MKHFKRELDRLWQKTDSLSEKDFCTLKTLTLVFDPEQITFNFSEVEMELLKNEINKATLEQIDSLSFLDHLELEESTTLHRLRACLSGEYGETASLESWEYLCSTFTSFESKVIELLK